MAKKKRVATKPRIGLEHIVAALDIVARILEDIRDVLGKGKSRAARRSELVSAIAQPCPDENCRPRPGMLCAAVPPANKRKKNVAARRKRQRL